MRRIAAICMCIIVVSCQRQATADMDATPLVSGILSDKSSPSYELLSSYEVPVNAELFVIGDSEASAIISDRLLRYDAHDNVSGASVSDGLPDFAGETIVQVNDAFAAPYYIFFQDAGDTRIREHFAHHVISSIDTVFNLTKYDIEGSGRKVPAKIVIFTDPFYARYGRKDTDFLLSGTSCGLQVFCPIELMRDELLSSKSESLNIGIVCDTLHSGFSLYRELIQEKAGNCNISCYSCNVTDSIGVLVKFLDAYRSAGGRKAVDVLMVDNTRVDLVNLYSEISRLRDLNRPECMTYGKLISPAFKVIDGSSVVAEACYRFLREKNLFTHKIAYPRRSYYTSVRNPGDSVTSFLLVPSDNVQD